jgi:hypothetical protein
MIADEVQMKTAGISASFGLVRFQPAGSARG